MASLTTTQIKLGDKTIKFYEHLSIRQEIGEHHTLTLHCRMADLLDDTTTAPMGSKQYLGAKILVSIQETRESENSQRSLAFKGIVTSITEPLALYANTIEMVSITAHSTTILAEQGKKYASYTDVDLTHIATQTLKDIDSDKLSFDLNPRNQNPIPYSVQYNESDFEYLARLARYHNEWLYYDGKKIILGSPSTQVVELVHKVHLKSFSYRFHPKPNNYTYVTHDYHTGEILQKQSSEVASSTEYFQKFTNDKGQEMYRKSNTILDTNIPYNPNMISTFDQKVTAHTKAIATSQITFTGSSDHTGVQLGKIIHIKNQGRYRITKITHTNNFFGDYENTFEAIDASIEVYPKTNLNATPKATSQFATVTDNNDPEGLGRIQVRFTWQLKGEASPWLLLVCPYAGLHRGFHMLPEIGDTVLVDFEGNNAERPYIIGSVRNMTTKPHDSLPNDTNDKKTIESRMELALVFDDNKKNPKLKLTDNKNLEIVIDKQAKKIGIHAVGDIELTGDNIKLCAKESIKLESQNQTINANEINIAATKKTIVMSSGKTQIKGNTVEHIMGGGAPSPKHSTPIKARAASKVATVVADTLMQNKTMPESKEEALGSIDSITLYDDAGKETTMLSDNCMIKAKTSGATNCLVHIAFHDPDTNLDIDLGNFFIPKDQYTIEIPYRHDSKELEE